MIKIKSKKKPPLTKGRGKGRKGKSSSPERNSKMENKFQTPNFFPETAFISCKRRKNQPKVSPMICEKRCPRMKGCPEYFDYLQPAMFERYEKRDGGIKKDR